MQKALSLEELSPGASSREKMDVGMTGSTLFLGKMVWLASGEKLLFETGFAVVTPSGCSWKNLHSLDISFEA